jgi:hypothetical protein
MEQNKKVVYEKPEVRAFDVKTEGVICASNDGQFGLPYYEEEEA